MYEVDCLQTGPSGAIQWRIFGAYTSLVHNLQNIGMIFRMAMSDAQAMESYTKEYDRNKVL